VANEKNIFGLDLKVDQNYLAEAVKQTVMLGIAEALNGKNEIVSQIVNSVLSTKVDKYGKISSYSGDNRYTLLECYVRNLLTDVTRDEIKKLVEEKRDELAAIIRKELSKKVTADTFVNNFISKVNDAIDATWCTKIDVVFDKRKE
jgi:hypothetical protein